MKKVLVKLVAWAFLVLYKFFRLFPQRNRVVAISRESNTYPKDFVLLRGYMTEAYPDVEFAILAKKFAPNPAYAWHLVQQIYCIATSKAVILDTYNVVVSLLAGHIKAPVIQMWHALGNMKRFGYTALNDPDGRSETSARLLHMHEGYTSVLISSMSFVKDYAAGFHIDPSIVYEAPLPRTDLLISQENRDAQRARIIASVPQLANGKKNIVYCPTFRQTESANKRKAMRELVNAINFDKYNLIVKAHPLDNLSIDDPHVIQGYDPSLDMLFAADYVISDYSTVIYEAGLIGAPVFLYGYDWDDYKQRRSLYIDIEHDVPTVFSRNAAEIMNAIEKGDFNQKAFGTFIARNVSVPKEGTCTQRVAEHVMRLMNK